MNLVNAKTGAGPVEEEGVPPWAESKEKVQATVDRASGLMEKITAHNKKALAAREAAQKKTAAEAEKAAVAKAAKQKKAEELAKAGDNAAGKAKSAAKSVAQLEAAVTAAENNNVPTAELMKLL